MAITGRNAPSVMSSPMPGFKEIPRPDARGHYGVTVIGIQAQVVRPAMSTVAARSR